MIQEYLTRTIDSKTNRPRDNWFHVSLRLIVAYAEFGRRCRRRGSAQQQARQLLGGRLRPGKLSWAAGLIRSAFVWRHNEPAGDLEKSLAR